MRDYERRVSRGSFYLRACDGRRTRLYITLEACYRAAERGELYTDTEYVSLTTPAVGAAPRKRRKHP